MSKPLLLMLGDQRSFSLTTLQKSSINRMANDKLEAIHQQAEQFWINWKHRLAMGTLIIPLAMRSSPMMPLRSHDESLQTVASCATGYPIS